ncbi:flagellar basal body rod protein FlgC [Naasia sp. SYSU D00948]|uniref:flagellar basal body rod protein FlgC n=1 Tax=Naasia sp. SYSU D00948 TaxID=2817379 RepID=UPI001B30EA09|nr:flagellar basal body rod C-terminal domain-containing protein [Naasia sp. SYSU D00948]
MTFDAIGIAGSALTVHRKWLDAISDNLANINTATSTADAAFQERFVIARANERNGGVNVAGTTLGSAEGRLAYDPTSPLADAEGMVRLPDIDLSQQMSSLIMAQRGYEANAAVVDRAKSTYEAALQIGRS